MGSESSTECARDVAEGAPSPLGSSETPSANSASLPLGPRPPTCPPLAQRRSEARRIRAPRTSRREVASTAFGCRRTTLKATRLVFVPWVFFVAPAIVTSPLCDSPVHIVFLPSATKPHRVNSRRKRKAALTPARGALSFALFRTTRVARSHCPVAQWQSR